MKLTFYRMATTLGGPLIRLYLNQRLKRGKEDPARFDERLGHASQARPTGDLVWLHAASIGESLSILPLIERIQIEHPNWTVLVTTGTVTSAHLMTARLPQGAIHQYVPVDCVSYVRRFLEHWRPDLALWVESEFWPNLVIETRARAVPMVVLNGRMSDGSYAKWQKNRAMIARILAAFPIILAQSDTDGERFRALGAKQVRVPGNLKFASPPLPVDDAMLEHLKMQIGARPVWLAASTHPGEEELCAATHAALHERQPGLLTIIVPRHPERGNDICRNLRERGLKVAQRSAQEDITPDTAIYVADTLGELGVFFRLCSVVFIGKTLAGGGGQNPIEPAQLSCALVFGPDMSNFADVAQGLLACAGARRVQDASALEGTISDLLANPASCTQMTENAEAFARSQAGVLDRVMEDLLLFFKNPQQNDPRQDRQTHART